MNDIHEACQAGTRDGMNFPLNDYEFTMNVFSRQFEDDARDAYKCSFLSAIGDRMNLAKIVFAN